MSGKRAQKTKAGVRSGQAGGQDGAGGKERAGARRDVRRETALRLERFARADAGVAARHLPSPPQLAGTGSRFSALMPAEEDHSSEDSMEEEVQGEGLPSAQGAAGLPATREAAEPSLLDVLQAIHQCNSSINKLSCQVGGIQEEVSLIRADLQKVSDRTTEVERRVGAPEDSTLPMRSDVNSNSLAIAELLSKTDDLENRLRRNNVRLVGVPEKVEGTDPNSFFESWLLEVIGRESLTPLFAVERAHRVPTRPGPPGRPPRPVLIKILHYKDRDIILRRARELQEILIDGRRVSFFPDYSLEVQKKRSLFLDIKKRLRALGVAYSMMYPAKLRIVAMGSAHFFDNAPDALRWLDVHEGQLRQLQRRDPDNA